MKKFLLPVIVAAFAGSLSAQSFTVDPSEDWFSYTNAFEMDNTTFAFGFGYTLEKAPAVFAPGTLTLGPNTAISIDNPTDAAWWVGGAVANGPNKIADIASYMEADSALNNLATFDYSIISNSLPVGYTAEAFVKVLDPDAGWATVQEVFGSVTSGAQPQLSLTVGTTVGTPKVQAGFYVRGPVTDVSGGSLVVAAVPEPSVIALLLGVAGLGLAFFRRRR